VEKGKIYIFKDEFKYVMEKKGWDDSSTCYGLITLDSETGMGRPTCLRDKSHT